MFLCVYKRDSFPWVCHHPPFVQTPAAFIGNSHQAIFEVTPEPRWLVALHLPVLDRTPTQVLVQLGDVDGSSTLFILRGGSSNPVVDISRLAGAFILTYLMIIMKSMRGDTYMRYMYIYLYISWNHPVFYSHIELCNSLPQRNCQRPAVERDPFAFSE